MELAGETAASAEGALRSLAGKPLFLAIASLGALRSRAAISLHLWLMRVYLIELRGSAESLLHTFLESLPDLDGKLLEVFEAILKEDVDFIPIDIQVVVHQNVPQSGHRNKPLCQVWLQISTLTEEPDRVPVLFHCSQPIVGHDMVGNIKDDLDGQLQVSLDISDHKRVSDKLLTRPDAQPSQQIDVLAQFSEALSNEERISQRKSPF
jgi:hypothetical protein